MLVKEIFIIENFFSIVRFHFVENVHLTSVGIHNIEQATDIGLKGPEVAYSSPAWNRTVFKCYFFNHFPSQNIGLVACSPSDRTIKQASCVRGCARLQLAAKNRNRKN